MICCVCLKNLKDTIKIFKGIGLTLQVAEVLTKHFWFKPKKNDAVSSNICPNCWEIVKNFNELYVSAENEHRVLKDAEDDSADTETEADAPKSAAAAKPTAAKPSAVKLTAVKPTAAKTADNIPSAAKPSAAKTAGSIPSSAKPSATKTTVAKPSANDPTTVKLPADEPATVKPAADKSATDEPIAATSVKASGGPKLPAIVVKSDPFGPLKESIAAVVEENSFTFVYRRNGYAHINCVNSTSYRAVVKYLKEENLKFHYFQLKEDKPYRVVAKNLKRTNSKAEIIKFLANLGHEVTYIGWNKSKGSGVLCYIDFKKKENNSEINKLCYICRQQVTIEVPPKAIDLVQCHRCQGYGHTRSYCTKDPVCVKCSEGHLTVDCKLSKEEPAKCVHCKANHPANFKGCQFYKNILWRIRPNTVEIIKDVEYAEKMERLLGLEFLKYSD